MYIELLHEILMENRDEAYRQMQISLIPNIQPDTIIGVRTPILRSIAKELEDQDCFLARLPHRYFEENQIHSFLLEREKDFDTAIKRIDEFLPFVDNWATCDQLRPRCFQKHRQELIPCIRKWITSDEPYTIRFGVGMLMVHYLDSDFDESYLSISASVHCTDYYVRMMIAWYFATALAKQFDAALPYITNYRLDKWVHNKAIQKSIESNRVPPEHKELLRAYRLK